jgi:hypothetical protein
MKRIADIVGYDTDNNAILFVEIKYKFNNTKGRVIKLLQELIEKYSISNIPFIMIILPEYFYLWDEKDLESDLKNPSYCVETKPFLQPYLEQSDQDIKDVDWSGFEMIAFSILTEIFSADTISDIKDKETNWLRETGLFERLKNGRLETEVQL